MPSGLAPVRPARPPGPSDGDRDPLDGVVDVAAGVPGRRHGLGVAGGVGGPRAQLVGAGGRLPAEAPAGPGPGRRLPLQLGRPPAAAAVDADLDPGHRGQARPGAAGQQVAAGREEPDAGLELGDAGGQHERAGLDAGHRRPRVALEGVDQVAAGLLEAGERLGEHADPAQPLDRGHAVPAGHDQPQRVAVLGRQGPAVDPPGEQDLGAHRLVQGQAALVVLLQPALDAPVGATEQHLDGVRADPGLLEQGRQGRPGPFRRPHRLLQPGLADRPRVQPGPPVAGALQGHRRGHLRAPAQLLHGQGPGRRHPPAELQRPGALVGLGDVEVDQQVVQPDRGEVVAQRLQRHAVVAGRQRQLLHGDAGRATLVGRGGGHGDPLLCWRSTPRRSWALRATTMVDRLIRAAPTAGPRVTPAQARAPAAIGTASRL